MTHTSILEAAKVPMTNMTVKPIYDTRALGLELGTKRALVVADLHLGIESELADSGIGLPSQIPKVKKRLLDLIQKQKPDKLIFLGDVKHNIPIASWLEWRDLPDFFAELSKLVRVEILPGNHDGDIKGLVRGDVTIHDVRGIVVGKDKQIGLMHGHTWPNPELLKTDLIVTGHNHPIVEFKDKLGIRMTEPVWLRCKLEPSKFPKKLQDEIKGEGLQILVMPAFSELIGGAAVNRAVPEELLGPMFKAGAVQFEDAEVSLLDGTLLGTVASLRQFAGNQH
jgi:hypothetical protein